MPTIRNSEEGRRLAEARWRKHREREAEITRLAELWGNDALAFSVMTKAEQERMIGAVLRQGAEATLAEIAPSVVLACAELGIDRVTAERLADLIALFVAAAIERSGGPEISLPSPESWCQTVNWDALYGPDGRSRVEGEITHASQAEMAEPTDED